MTYHRHHRSPRALLLALACLIACGSARLAAQTPEQQTAAGEKVTHAEIQRPAASSKPADRISALEELASQSMDFDLFMKLMNDPDPEVRLEALSALEDFCGDERNTLPPEVARQMTALMEAVVTKERIQAAFVDKDSKKEEDADIGHLCDYALALSHLYQQTPLLGTPDRCKYWQERVLKFLIICLVYDRDEHGDAHEEHLYLVLGQITDPDVLTQALEFVLENLDDLRAARQLTALEELWVHPLLGADKPLNLLLLQQLGTVWEPVRDHLLRNIKPKQRKEEAAGLMTRIDAAFAQARQQLAPQPAPDAKK